LHTVERDRVGLTLYSNLELVPLPGRAGRLQREVLISLSVDSTGLVDSGLIRPAELIDLNLESKVDRYPGLVADYV